jgi:hypothetical protein
MEQPEYDYYEPDGSEPYHLKADQGYGTCGECGSYLENWGACSDGDGDLYDDIGCPNCQETRRKDYAPGYDPDGEDFWALYEAFAMGLPRLASPKMVFDWDKAAQIIRAAQPTTASAGLAGDWDYTGGEIYRDGKPVDQEDTSTYLASTWATPQLDLDGDVQDCYIMEDEAFRRWNNGQANVDFAHIYWPPSALALLRGEVIEVQLPAAKLPSGDNPPR